MYRPYILLKDIDNEPYWRPYGGEKIEDLRKYHAWELEAQKKFKDEHRSQEEIDYLRNLLMSITMIASFFEFDETFKQDMLGELLARMSIQWYCKDNKVDIHGFRPEGYEDKLNPYYNLVAFYVSSFFTTVQNVQVNAASASAKS